VAGALRDIDNEKTLVEASERRVAQLSASSSRLAGVSVDLSKAVEAAVSRAAAASGAVRSIEEMQSSMQEQAIESLIQGV
jgi:hypothetical protein